MRVRVLVTGGAGFIGSHIVEALVSAGHETAVADDLSTGRERNLHPAARFYRLDIRDPAAVDRCLAEFRPAAVSHQAAQTSVAVSTREPARDAEINVLGTIHLLGACVRHGVERLVFASTGGAIYGEVEGERRAKVGDQTHPLSPYACSKLAVEHYLDAWRAELGFHSTVLRYANVYGPRQDPHGEAGVVAIFARRILDGSAIQINAMRDIGDDGCIRDYVYVGDVVRANLTALAGKLGDRTINVCTGVAADTKAIARGLMAELGRTVTIGHGPRRAGDLLRSVLDPTEMEALLGAPVGLEAGLAETGRWFREHGP